MIEIDKIPIDKFKQDSNTGEYKLGTLVLSVNELANAQKINDLIDELVKVSDRLTKVENK